MIDSLCQNYGWSYQETMRMTLPQIVMLNHAATVNAKRVEIRVKAKSNKDKQDPVVHNNKRLSELDSNDMASYYADIR